MAGRIEPSEMQQFGQILGVIHRRACEQRTTIQPVFEDGRFFESLRLEPYYAYSATQMPAAREPLQELIDQTRRRRTTITHGDYSPKNILVHEGKLVLLDHEVIHWGDPAFDLGFGLAHLISKAHHLCKHRDAMVDAAATFWSAYKQEIVSLPWAKDVEVFAVWHLLACLLARAVGRSKLEYLSPAERERQAAAAATLLQDRPTKVLDAAHAFLKKV